MPVEVRFEGDPPDGFKQLGFQVTPEQVRLSGPESHVQAVEKAYTETISLAGISQPHLSHSCCALS